MSNECFSEFIKMDLLVQYIREAYHTEIAVGLRNGIVTATSKQICNKYLENALKFKNLFDEKMVMIEDYVTNIDIMNESPLIRVGDMEQIFSSTRVKSVYNLIGCNIPKASNEQYMNTISNLKAGDLVKIIGVLYVQRSQSGNIIFILGNSILLSVNNNYTNIAKELYIGAKEKYSIQEDMDTIECMESSEKKTFTIEKADGNISFTWTSKERKFKEMYLICQKKIEESVAYFQKIYEKDCHAIGFVKLSSFSSAIKKCPQENVDPTPFAAELLYIIDSYRKKHDYDDPDMALYNIAKGFNSLGDEIFQRLLEIAGSPEEIAYLNRKLQESRKQYVFDSYDSISISRREELLEDFFEKEMEQIGECTVLDLIQDDDRYSDIYTALDEISEVFPVSSDENKVRKAQKEIEWRSESAKLKQILINKLRTELEKEAFVIMKDFNDKMHLCIPSKYFSYDNYLNAKQVFEKVLKATDFSNQAIVCSAFESFPFDSYAYKCLLKIFGDSDGVIYDMALFLKYETFIEKYKKEIFEEFASKLPWLLKKNIPAALEQQQSLLEKRKFLSYTGQCDVETKLEKKIATWSEKEKRKKEKYQINKDKRKEDISLEKENETENAIIQEEIDETPSSTKISSTDKDCVLRDELRYSSSDVNQQSISSDINQQSISSDINQKQSIVVEKHINKETEKLSVIKKIILVIVGLLVIFLIPVPINIIVLIIVIIFFRKRNGKEKNDSVASSPFGNNTEENYCTNCGKLLENGENYCIQCGNKIK